MASDLSGKLVTGVFLLGVGLGTTVGWQAACALYRTEDKREAIRAKTAMYISLYGNFGLEPCITMSLEPCTDGNLEDDPQHWWMQ
mmetsp:Transcript_27541/g.59932  ORF Transcript_27541/g.59932 Transcript_27541/m.59932 type:complete len:85 (-) Transcript_27541:26-280(-)